MLSEIPFNTERRGSSMDHSQNQISLLDSEGKEIAPKVYLLPMQQEKQTAEVSNASYHTFSKAKKHQDPGIEGSGRPTKLLFFKKVQQPHIKQKDLSPDEGLPPSKHTPEGNQKHKGSSLPVTQTSELGQYIRALQREIGALRKVVEHLTNSIAARDNLIRELNARITKPVADKKQFSSTQTQMDTKHPNRFRARSVPTGVLLGLKSPDPKAKTLVKPSNDQDWTQFVESALLAEPPELSESSEPQESKELASYAQMSKHKTFVKAATTDSNAFAGDGDSHQIPSPQPENTTKTKHSMSIPRKSGKKFDPILKALRIQELIDYVSQNPSPISIQTSEIADLKEYRTEKDLLHQFLASLREGGSLTTQEFRSLFVSHLPQMRRMLLHITESYEKRIFGNLRLQSITHNVLQAASKGFGGFSQDLRLMLTNEMGCEDVRLFLLVPGDPRFYYWSEIDHRFESFLPKVSIDKLKSKPGKTRQTNFESDDFDSQLLNKESEIEKIFGYRLKNQLAAKIFLKQNSKSADNGTKNLYHQQIVGFLYCMNKYRHFSDERGGVGRLQRKLHSNYSQMEFLAQQEEKDAHDCFQYSVDTSNLQPLGDPTQIAPKYLDARALQAGKNERLTQDFSVDDVALINLLSTSIGGLMQASIFSMQFEDHIREEAELLKLFPTLLQQNTLKTILLEGQRLLQRVFNSKRARVALLHDSDIWFLVESLHIRQAKKPKWVTAPEPSSDSMIERTDSLDEDEIIEQMIKSKSRPYSPSKFGLQSGIGTAPEGVASSEQKNTTRFMKVQMSERELLDVNHYQLAQVITTQAGVLGWVARHPNAHLSDSLNEETNFEAESDIDTCLPALTLPIFDPRRKDPIVFGVVQVELMNLGIKLLRGERKDTLAQAYTSTASKICNVLGIFIASKFDSFPEFCKEDPVSQLDLDTDRLHLGPATALFQLADTTI